MSGMWLSGSDGTAMIFDLFPFKPPLLPGSIGESHIKVEGEEFYAAIKRSTNGGGENSLVLKGEDDFYEMFFADLETGVCESV